MSRGAVARRGRANTGAGLALCGRVAGDVEEEDGGDEGERLREENARLRDQVAEVEGWYRLLEADHAAVREHERRAGLRTTELQVEANRLDGENQQLRALVARLDEAGRVIRGQHEESTMNRIGDVIRGVRAHKWATAAVVAVATLLVRDAAVQGVVAAAAARARQATFGDRSDREPSGSGFVRYAAMINGRDQLARARKEYNAAEGTLKGDALLEAQDRLRAARARDRQARLAFLPELARHCEQAGIPLPAEAAEALVALRAETND